MWTGFYRNGRGAFLVIAGMLALAACQTPAPPPGQRPGPPAPAPVQQPQQSPAPQAPLPEAPSPEILTPPHMEGRKLLRIGLLLPFGADSAALRNEARSMLKAAQMAIFEAADPRLVLLPKDSAGTPEEARSSAEAMIAEGAGIIMGPVLSDAVAAAGEAAKAAHIPIIAFSTDRSVAGDGVYLLSFMPEADIARMVDFIDAQNRAAMETLGALRPDAQTTTPAPATINAVALLRPEGRYGDRVEEALFTFAPRAGLAISDIAYYGSDVQSMDAPARQIAHVRERQAAIAAWKKAGGAGDPSLDPDFVFSLPYQAVFLPESGVRLRSLAPLLPFYDVDPKITRFIGVHLWNDETLLREPALFGGWFPGPASAPHDAFMASYDSAFGEKPGRLASLAHDAVMVTAQISRQDQDEQQASAGSAIDGDALLRPEGFYGADGRFRFGPDGLVQRLLSVFEIRPGKTVEIDPAPPIFTNPDQPGNAAY